MMMLGPSTVGEWEKKEEMTKRARKRERD